MLDDLNFERSHVFNDCGYVDRLTCHAWVAVAIGGSAIIGAGASIYGSSKAADAQKDASEKSAQISREQFNMTNAMLMPYRGIGQVGQQWLQDNGELFTKPIDFTDGELENTPGYGFLKRQGAKAVANSAAARGLGVSGAALKAGATFAKDLADTTYTNRFNLENINRTNLWNRTKSLIDTGHNASAQVGTIGAGAAGQQMQATMAGGNAAAAGYNAMGSAIGQGARDLGGYAMYKGLYGGNSGGGDVSSSQMPSEAFMNNNWGWNT